MTDEQALDQLRFTLGDVESTPEYIVEQAKSVVEATGREIAPVTGD